MHRSSLPSAAITEYHSSPDARGRYIAQQAQVSHWVSHTNAHAHTYSDPFERSLSESELSRHHLLDDKPDGKPQRPIPSRSLDVNAGATRHLAPRNETHRLPPNFFGDMQDRVNFSATPGLSAHQRSGGIAPSSGSRSRVLFGRTSSLFRRPHRSESHTTGHQQPQKQQPPVVVVETAQDRNVHSSFSPAQRQQPPVVVMPAGQDRNVYSSFSPAQRQQLPVVVMPADQDRNVYSSFSPAQRQQPPVVVMPADQDRNVYSSFSSPQRQQPSVVVVTADQDRNPYYVAPPRNKQGSAQSAQTQGQQTRPQALSLRTRAIGTDAASTTTMAAASTTPAPPTEILSRPRNIVNTRPWWIRVVLFICCANQ